MTVYVVICNGILNEIFTNRESADVHAENLLKKWNIVKVVEKIVNSI
jgi:hypothetical protein